MGVKRPGGLFNGRRGHGDIAQEIVSSPFLKTSPRLITLLMRES
jgi:hypothetical protein